MLTKLVTSSLSTSTTLCNLQVINKWIGISNIKQKVQKPFFIYFFLYLLKQEFLDYSLVR